MTTYMLILLFSIHSGEKTTYMRIPTEQTCDIIGLRHMMTNKNVYSYRCLEVPSKPSPKG